MYQIIRIAILLFFIVKNTAYAGDDNSMGNMAMDSMMPMNHTMSHDMSKSSPQVKKRSQHLPRIVHKAVDSFSPMPTVHMGMPVMDQGDWFHGILNEFEGRYQPNGGSAFRWSGDAWYGSDYNRLWLKSEGTMARGKLHDGTQEILYSRAVSRYFNFQTGIRLDLDSGPTRPWGAIGLEGLSLYQFDIRLAGYISGRGVAARFEGSYDILLTNRLILQPQVEIDAYSQSDRDRSIGSGVSNLDTGLRLRYEIWRKVAPYVGVSYDTPLFKAYHLARQQREEETKARFTFGIRSWF